MSNQSIIRITRELGEIQKSSDLSLAVACRDVDVRSVKTLVIGPPDTPYEFGFYEFAFRFTKEYPAKAPGVTCLTTNGGRCRFNPNIYANGKVCLSILGTWRGEPGEEWSSAQGLESILISIQSLMSGNPYENEPGFEDARTSVDKQNMANYIAKIRHESLRISVIQRLEEYLGINSDGTVHAPPYLIDNSDTDPEDDSDDAMPAFEPFRDLCKRRFLWYYDSYCESIANGKQKCKDDEPFVKMPFECTGNGMDGKFRFTELERRLKFVRQTLMEETKKWGVDGMSAKIRETGIAANLQRQFEQTVETYKRDRSVTLNFELVDNNPFVWQVTYFGRSVDGGLFQIKIYFSPRFPDEQPRVIFDTPMFHHRISKDGVLCYFPRRVEDAKSHIEAIVDALEEQSPPYDPRTTVNPEAARLYWGSPDDRKAYNRRLRRALERSLE
ncbi:MAG: hypothetical protein M1825_004966 [Sarcosagium campestre]|nr:MAG: hypothetical protein M1825_004966 [Sarcosagium campestre]